ncbi:MAG: YbjN domain-containing protein [Hyphomonadaceae bacterium]
MSERSLIALAGLAALDCAAAGPASATPVDPADVRAALILNGAAINDADEYDGGVYSMSGQIDNYAFNVKLLGCTDNRDCATVMIYSLFDAPGDPPIEAYEKVNGYNDNYLDGRAFILRADGNFTYGFDLVIQLDGEEAFSTLHVKRFQSALGDFVDHMKD